MTLDLSGTWDWESRKVLLFWLGRLLTPFFDGISPGMDALWQSDWLDGAKWVMNWQCDPWSQQQANSDVFFFDETLTALEIVIAASIGLALQAVRAT